jgi:hypothetical protein
MKVEKLEWGSMSSTTKAPNVTEKPILLFVYTKGEGNCDGRFPVAFAIFRDSAKVETYRRRYSEDRPDGWISWSRIYRENSKDQSGCLAYRERKIVFCRTAEEAEKKAKAAAERFSKNEEDK